LDDVSRKAKNPWGLRTTPSPGLQIYFHPRVTWKLDLLTHKSFHVLAPWTTCASLHQNWFLNSQKIVFTNLVTDRRTYGRMNGQVKNIVPLPVSLA